LGGASLGIGRVLGRMPGFAAVDLIVSDSHLYWLKLRWDEEQLQMGDGNGSTHNLSKAGGSSFSHFFPFSGIVGCTFNQTTPKKT